MGKPLGSAFFRHRMILIRYVRRAIAESGKNADGADDGAGYTEYVDQSELEIPHKIGIPIPRPAFFANQKSDPVALESQQRRNAEKYHAETVIKAHSILAEEQPQHRQQTRHNKAA